MDILQIVKELQALAKSGTRVPGMRNKVLLDVERLNELGDELRGSIPTNIQEAEEIIKQKDSILSQAHLEAQRIKQIAEGEASAVISGARAEHMQKVDESEIVKAAETKGQEMTDEAMMEGALMLQETQKNAYRIISEAEATASKRRDGADQYAREVLFNLEEQLSGLVNQVRGGIDLLRLESEAKGSENHNHAPSIS